MCNVQLPVKSEMDPRYEVYDRPSACRSSRKVDHIIVSPRKSESGVTSVGGLYEFDINMDNRYIDPRSMMVETQTTYTVATASISAGDNAYPVCGSASKFRSATFLIKNQAVDTNLQPGLVQYFNALMYYTKNRLDTSGMTEGLVLNSANIVSGSIATVISGTNYAEYNRQALIVGGATESQLTPLSAILGICDTPHFIPANDIQVQLERADDNKVLVAMNGAAAFSIAKIRLHADVYDPSPETESYLRKSGGKIVIPFRAYQHDESSISGTTSTLKATPLAPTGCVAWVSDQGWGSSYKQRDDKTFDRAAVSRVELYADGKLYPSQPADYTQGTSMVDAYQKYMALAGKISDPNGPALTYVQFRDYFQFHTVDYDDKSRCGIPSLDAGIKNVEFKMTHSASQSSKQLHMITFCDRLLEISKDGPIQLIH